MVDFQYLVRGLCGMAHAHRANTMAGHLGAAVVTGYLWSEDVGPLEEGVIRGVEGELDRIIRGDEDIWYDRAATGLSPEAMFAAIPQAEPAPDGLAPIARALESNGPALLQSGHNVIFASIALRALSDHPELAYPELVQGIAQLITGFKGKSGGRGFWGKQNGWRTAEQIPDSDLPPLPPYGDLAGMAQCVLSELSESTGIHRQGFGGLWHVINHAAGLCELHRQGFVDLARRGLPGHHRHVRLWKSLPDLTAELGKRAPAAHDPRKPQYWQLDLERKQARLTHRIKTLYGFEVLASCNEDEALGKRARQALNYLLA